MDSDIIKDALEIAEERWNVEQDEVVQDVPPCSEAVEDEVKALEAAITSLVQENNKDVANIHFRALIVRRMIGADVPVWDVKGCIEGRCDLSSCTARHHLMARFLAAKRSDGAYVVLKEEEIIDRIEENPACGDGKQRVMLLPDNIVNVLAAALEDKINAGDDDPLPPATIVNPLPVEESALSLLRRAGQRMAQKTWQALQKAGFVS